MKTKVVKEFWLDGELVMLRYPRYSDWRDTLDQANSLVRERAFISIQTEITEKQSRKWMSERMEVVRKKECVSLSVEIRGRVIGLASIWEAKDEPGRGYLGISMRSSMPDNGEKLWGRGIGEKLLRTLMREAKVVLKIKVVKLGAFVANHGAIALYKKCGFKETHRIKRERIHYGAMRDRIYMKKRLR